MDIEADTLAKRMAAQLLHRGPDGAGYYADESVVLAHTRLSIIGLSGGQQPIHNEDKSIWVVFNGEIFNYLELRAELKKKGHKFYTDTDTEVLVHLYEEHGEDFVSKLNGQFAICLWDRRRKKALLIRDRVGIAPLYFQQTPKGVYFGSEIKAILAGTGKSPKLNIEALDQLLSCWTPVAPNSIFDGIFQISPGEMIVIHSGKLVTKQYWDLQFPANNQFEDISEDEAIETVHDLLFDATRIRLRADVPVAAYLSGGLDSSILVSLIKHIDSAPLQTFSLTFADKGLDEEKYQAIMVDRLATKHASIHCANEDLGEHFLDSIWHIESPVIRTAPIPMGMLSSLVHENQYKVVLTGEGADEVFGGYDIFKETKIREFWSRNPASKWRPLLIKKLYPYLDLSRSNNQAFLRNFFGDGVEEPNYPLFSHMPRSITTAKIKQFYSDATKEQLSGNAAEALIATLPAGYDDWALFNKAQYLEIKTLMGGYLLSSQGDRMLMKNSVEGRFPFLDHRVIEFANRLKPSLKMKVLNEKYVLKKAMEQYLPKNIVKRYKQPYRAPNIPAFFGDKKFDYVDDLLSSESIGQSGYFDSKKVSLLMKKIRAGRPVSYKDNMALVLILSTQAWHHMFVNQFSENIFNCKKGIDIDRVQ
ncbi:MAG: asparagine synthase (glutamine-hydrolyzing) [Candidatus Polarisedimenticolaceae bacterium]|nr:asparagine synthase (glutamine-hydrolyzing) [Candidatus Polarisedimenticolaceae bacterium]